MVDTPTVQFPFARHLACSTRAAILATFVEVSRCLRVWHVQISTQVKRTAKRNLFHDQTALSSNDPLAAPRSFFDFNERAPFFVRREYR